MIASIYGRIDAIGTDWLVINVNGVGFKISVPTSVLGEGGTIGREIKLFTHLHVREDELTLYGFIDQQDMRIFEMVLSVSGIGPKTALAMLSAMNADQLSLAIASADTAMLTSIPGIGKKTAERLILELKDKVGAIVTVTTGGRMAQENADVIAALSSLGYSIAEGTRAVGALPDGKKLSLEERLKLALQYLGK
jgi:holliday junction DNA helicase RuvA